MKYNSRFLLNIFIFILLATPLYSQEQHKESRLVTIDSAFIRGNKLFHEQRFRKFRLPQELEDPITILPEAKFIINKQLQERDYINSNLTFKDTVIVNPLFLPIVFRGNILPDNLNFRVARFQNKDPFSQLIDTIEPFSDFQEDLYMLKLATDYVIRNRPNLVKYSCSLIPKETVPIPSLNNKPYEGTIQKELEEEAINTVQTPGKYVPKRRYWIHGFQSSIQFSQNYISGNWHKGGSSTNSLYSRFFLKSEYNRNKFNFISELESKLNIITAPKDTIHSYKISDDLFRWHGNLGYLAYHKWYYSLDSEIKTQLFTNYQTNTKEKSSTLGSPISFNIGLGMKYKIDKKYDPHGLKRLKLSVNIAPISYTFMHVFDKEINVKRHGLKEGTQSLNLLGSTLRADMDFKFNPDFTWYSRMYYSTNYNRVIYEFENRFNMQLTQFFSTQLNIHIRFDDAVSKAQNKDTFWQVNELLSFGFNYRW